ncbi:MAG: nuclear transport factor 2 family protein [Nonomuraea sp.]|nr:nuclear transport factor 2 family protein [Nonomuraea sp.]
MPDFAEFLTRLPYELAFSEEPPEQIVDRYYAPGMLHRSDGLTLDRQKLIDHARPARKNTRELQITVHELLVQGDRAAARYTMDVVMRKGRRLSFEIHVFATLAPDGRVQQAEALTRECAGME